MAITPEALRIVDRIRAQLTTMTDAQTLTLTRAWVEAWDAIVPEFELALLDLLAGASTGYVSRSQAAKSIRLRDALQSARATLNELATVTEVTVAGDIAQAVLDAVDGHAALVSSQLPPKTAAPGPSFTRMSPDALAAIVERTTAQIHSATLPLAGDTERVMKRALIRGIAVGDNPRRTATRIMAATEQRFNGGLTRALVISRTETLDAHRAATQASERVNTKILEDWEWHAALDARTCPSCLAKHGTRHPLTESGPNDHHQGRCARVSVTKTWEELGFKGIAEPQSVTPNAQDWFNNLTGDTQLAIMGPGRLELLNAGRIGWADLSTVRHADGWRDSHTVTPLKDLLAKAT